MKKRIYSLLLVAVLTVATMTGCRAGSVGQTAESAANTAERGAEEVGSHLKANTSSASTGLLTLEEAKQIALGHAGLSSDLVIGLHAEYEIEHGTPIYDVEFHHRAWEYDYEIHADTGEILSFSKDN